MTSGDREMVFSYRYMFYLIAYLVILEMKIVNPLNLSLVT